MVGSFEGNLWTGETANSFVGSFIDERADEALQAISAGKQVAGQPASPN